MRQEVDCILVHEQRDEPEYGACEFGEVRRSVASLNRPFSSHGTPLGLSHLSPMASQFFVNVPEDIALTLFQSKMAIPLR